MYVYMYVYLCVCLFVCLSLSVSVYLSSSFFSLSVCVCCISTVLAVILGMQTVSITDSKAFLNRMRNEWMVVRAVV